MSHIVIIGAGITGVTTADALLERGHTVTVLDRGGYAAMEASFANDGQLSASNAEVWNNTSTTVKGLRWMFRRGVASNGPQHELAQIFMDRKFSFGITGRLRARANSSSVMFRNSYSECCLARAVAAFGGIDA
jgi:glycine/D-amino acid oxidase-like deaminating enzyme